MRIQIKNFSMAAFIMGAGCLAGSAVIAQHSAGKITSTVTTDECIQMTWFGGAAGAKGKVAKGQIDSATGEGSYAWKNGKLKFSMLGDEGGRLNGMEGSWKQDGAEGTFSVSGSYYDAPMVGTWSSKKEKKKNKLIIGLCKK